VPANPFAGATATAMLDAVAPGYGSRAAMVSHELKGEQTA
jgi:hypothetical protein